MPCLLYTGSQVSAISEKFFKEHLAEKWEDIHLTFKWLKITATSGLELPYMGYVELVLQLAAKIQGGTQECRQVRQLTVSKRFLYTIFTTVKESARFTRACNGKWCANGVTRLVGMNIVGKCRELVHQEFDTTMGGKLDSHWKEVFQHFHTVNVADQPSFARVAGRNVVILPALSVSTVMDRGLRTVGEKGSLSPLEPTSLSLPGGLVLL